VEAEPGGRGDDRGVLPDGIDTPRRVLRSECSLTYHRGVPETITGRAQPLSVAERRSMIIGAVTPLVIAKGRAVTSRQMAEAAGVAEGTIFRAFGDKESLIAAVVDRFLDPEPLREGLRSIDPALPLDQKISDILFHLRSRFQGVFGMMNALGMTERPPIPNARNEYVAIIVDLLKPDLGELRVTPELVTRFVRLIAFSTAIPAFNDSTGFTTEELVSLIQFGVAGAPAEREDPHAS
jgi:AcrR family transcriptional regulator